MALAAAQVVDAVAALIAPQAGLGTGGVKTSRNHPWAESELPAVRCFAADEEVELSALDGSSEQHTLEIEAQYSTRDTTDLDDTLHALAAGGLALIFADPPYDLRLTRITRSMATEGEASVGRISLLLESTFFVNPAAPETITSL